MPITQRICEASDALLMIKEGSLVDYVKSWGDTIPKANLKERITEINKGLGCELSEAYKIYQIEQTFQERFLEIGDKITLVQRKGDGELYLKHEEFWIRSARLATSLDALCTESSMFQPESVYTLCSENEIYRPLFLLTDANSASKPTSSDHTSMDGLEAVPDLWLFILTCSLYSSESNTGSKAAKR